MFDTFVESTLLMFVAIDPISLIPIFAGLTAGLNKHQVKSVYLRASFVSLVVLTIFWLFGNAILDAMNISMDSFKIIGGLFLIVIAFQMVFEQRQTRRQNTADTAIDDETIKSIAIFPLVYTLDSWSRSYGNKLIDIKRILCFSFRWPGFISTNTHSSVYSYRCYVVICKVIIKARSNHYYCSPKDIWFTSWSASN